MTSKFWSERKESTFDSIEENHEHTHFYPLSHVPLLDMILFVDNLQLCISSIFFFFLRTQRRHLSLLCNIWFIMHNPTIVPLLLHIQQVKQKFKIFFFFSFLSLRSSNFQRSPLSLFFDGSSPITVFVFGLCFISCSEF